MPLLLGIPRDPLRSQQTTVSCFPAYTVVSWRGWEHQMDVEVSIGGPDQLDVLASLEDWLLNEPDLKGCPVTRPPATPQPGQMGALSEVLVVALGSGGMGVALARSLSVWLSTRFSELPIRIRTSKGEVEFKARNTEDAKALLELLTPLVSGSDSDPA